MLFCCGAHFSAWTAHTRSRGRSWTSATVSSQRVVAAVFGRSRVACCVRRARGRGAQPTRGCNVRCVWTLLVYKHTHPTACSGLGARGSARALDHELSLSRSTHFVAICKTRTSRLCPCCPLEGGLSQNSLTNACRRVQPRLRPAVREHNGARVILSGNARCSLYPSLRNRNLAADASLPDQMKKVDFVKEVSVYTSSLALSAQSSLHVTVWEGLAFVQLYGDRPAILFIEGRGPARCVS